MTQNKKKGIAKKALSVSLVAAMLATSNVPAWASGFTAEEYGVASQGFAPADDGGMPMLQATTGSITLGADLNNGNFDLYDVQSATNATISADPTPDAGTDSGFYHLVLVTADGTVKILETGEVTAASTAVNLGYNFATNNEKVTAGTYTVDVYYSGTKDAAGSACGINGSGQITITDTTPEAPVEIGDVLDTSSKNAVETVLKTTSWNDIASMDAIVAAAEDLQTVAAYDLNGVRVVFINGEVDGDGNLTANSNVAGEYTHDAFLEYLGKPIAVEVTVKNRSDGAESTFYLAKSGAVVDSVDISQDVTGWEATINNRTYSNTDKDSEIAYSEGYHVSAVTLYLDDDKEIAVELTDTTSGITLETDGTNTVNQKLAIKVTAAANNTAGLKNTYTSDPAVKIVGQDLENLVSFHSGTLDYTPWLTTEKAIKELVDAGVVEVDDQLTDDDYEVVLYKNNSGAEYKNSEIVQAGDVYIGIKGKDAYAEEKVISDTAITVNAKDLSTLAEVQSVIDDITWTNENDVKSQINKALDKIVKFDSAANANDFELTKYSSELKVDVDSPEEAGEEAVITITPVSGKHNYTGEKEIRFVPTVSDLPSDVVSALKTAINGANWTYDAQYHVVNNLTDKDLGEISRSQYTLSVKDKPVSEIKDAGNYTIVMTVISGPYKDMTAEATLRVAQRNVENLFGIDRGVTANEIIYNVDGYGNSNEQLKAVNPTFTYNGEVLDDNDMVNGITVNIGSKAGDGITASFAGKGNYTGNVNNVKVGTVQPKDLNDLELPEIPTQAYGGEYNVLDNILIEDKNGNFVGYDEMIVDGKDGRITLNGDDYVVSIDVPESGMGTATVTLKGKGNYTGTVVKTFEIAKQTITADIGTMVDNEFKNVIDPVEYGYTEANSRDGITLSFEKTGKEGIIVRDRITGDNVTALCDITYTNNRAAGTATVEATGKDGYDIYATTTFVILPKQIKDAPKLAQDGSNGTDAWDYTGEEIAPKVAKGQYTDGAYTLVEGVDYEVAYSNNVEAENATDKPTVTVTGLGNYAFGSVKNIGVTKNFTINKVNLTSKNVVVKDVAYAGGLQITPDITIYNPVTMKAIPSDHFTFKYTEGGTNAGKADVTITLTEAGEKGYTINPALTVSFMVTKKALSDCSAVAVNGEVIVKNGEVTVPASEYTVKDNGDGTYTVTANADSNYTGSVTATESVPETPGATVLSVAERTTSTVTMNWDKVDGAEGYTIWYRSEYDTEMSRKIIFDGEQTSWTLKGLQPGTKYFFAMRSWVKDAEGNYIFSDVSPTQRGTTKPLAATIIGVTVTDGKIKVRLAGEAEGAEMYSMCYGDSRACFKENDFKVGIRTQYTTRTLNKTFEPGTYYVCVKSYRDLGNNKRVYGEWSNTFRAVVK